MSNRPESVLSDGTRSLRLGTDEPSCSVFTDELLWTGTRRAIDRAGLEITEELSSAGRAAVFAVRERRTHRRLALKVLLNPDDRRALAAFRRERRILSADFLPGQLVPRCVTSVAGEEMQPFLVMEQVDGQPLDAAARNLQARDRIRLIRDFFAAVETLHQSGLAHGGLRPSRVLLDSDHQLRFVGFGDGRRLAGAVSSHPGTSVAERSRRARPSADHTPLAGTGAVQNADRLTGQRADVQAAAALSCWLLTLAPVQDPASDDDSATSHASEDETGQSAVGARGMDWFQAVLASGDSSDISREMERSGIPGPVAAVLQKALCLPDDRGEGVGRCFHSAGEVAAELSCWLTQRDHSCHRMQTGLLLSVAAALVLAAGLWGWRRSPEVSSAELLNEIAALEAHVSDRALASHTVVGAALQRVEALQTQRSRLLARGDRRAAAELLIPLRRELERAIGLSDSLDQTLQVRSVIGQLLAGIPWQRHSGFISDRLDVLESRFRRTGQLLATGQLAGAGQMLRSLEADLSALMRDNALAASADRSRRRYLELRSALSDRLESMEEFTQIVRPESEAADAWNAGDWVTAQQKFELSRQRLQNWLWRAESFDERLQRELDHPELYAEVTDRLQQIRQQRKELANQQAISVQRLNHQSEELQQALSELTAARQTIARMEQMHERERAGRTVLEGRLSAAQRELQQAQDAVEQLLAEKQSREQQISNLQTAQDNLERQTSGLDRELVAVRQRAEEAVQRSERLQSELGLWKKYGGPETAAAIEIALREQQIEEKVAALSATDHARALEVVRESEERLREAERLRDRILSERVPDSDAVRAMERQLASLESAQLEAVRRLSEIELELYENLHRQMDVLKERLHHLTVVRGMKADAAEAQQLNREIVSLAGRAAWFEAARGRLKSIDDGDIGLARQFARNLSFAGKTAGQRRSLETRFGDIGLRWIPPRNRPSDRTASRQGFWMLETEVTQDLFTAVSGETLSELFTRRTVEVDVIGSEAGDVPVYFVSHDDAQRFCDALTRWLHQLRQLPEGWRVRLPTEAQWEFAAGSGRPVSAPEFIGDYRLTQSAWFSFNSGGAAHPVGRKAPTPWGLHDTVGNVYEWIRQEQPGDRATVRGASWGSPAEAAGAASRRVVDRDFRSSEVGFRFVIEAVDR